MWSRSGSFTASERMVDLSLSPLPVLDILLGFEEVHKLSNCLADVGLSLPVVEGKELADPIRKVRNVLSGASFWERRKSWKSGKTAFGIIS